MERNPDRSHALLTAAWLLVLMVSLPGVAVGMACKQVTLMDASGVPGLKHVYTLSGHCFHSFTMSKDSFGTGGFSSTSTNYYFGVNAVGEASWDSKTLEARQSVKFTGEASGKRFATGNCAQDPFLEGAHPTCYNIKVEVVVDSGKIASELGDKEFWFRSSVPLAQAQAMSANKDGATSPPPPPPKPVAGSTGGTQGASLPAQNTVATPAGGPAVLMPRERGSARVSPAGDPSGTGTGTYTGVPPQVARAGATVQPTLLNVEVEDLVATGRYRVAGGSVRAQSMQGFGEGWSNGGQLFWSGGSVGAVLDLMVDIPASATYAVEVYFTKAPDYADVKLEVAGQPAGWNFSGIAPRVMAPVPQQMGKFVLQAGQQPISLMIVGRSAQSTGYNVGIDRIRLYPAGAP